MKNYREYVRHIHDEVQYILTQSQGLTYEQLIDNPTLLRAMVRSIEVIGEVSKKIPSNPPTRA